MKTQNFMDTLTLIQQRAQLWDFYLNNPDTMSYAPIKTLDDHLSMLVKKLSAYNFATRIKTGATLLVGEGNLSFTVSLVRKWPLSWLNLATSTHQNIKVLSQDGQANAQWLKQRGIKVHHGMDATLLHCMFAPNAFDTIIFQFPHSGTRQWIDGMHENYILVRDFMISAFKVLKKGGVVVMTVVDSDCYNTMFRFPQLVKDLGVPEPTKYPFYPKDYPEYTHTMTHQEESGIDNYSKFATYEF